MRRILNAIVAVAGAVLVTAALPAHGGSVFVNANIALSETWTADNEYILTQPIYVTSGATLTIEPGTVIRGEGESSPGANDPGTLIIARGSKLQAIGTKLKPIVFTNLDDDNVGGNPGSFPYDSAANALGVTGTWGGVILLGRGYVANNTLAGPIAGREVQIEGLTAAGGLGLYGNCAASVLFPSGCDDDDSGSIRYVSLRYGGFNLSANNEINGLTLGAVGRETDIDHVEVFQNKDDGIEFFGGAVGVKHAVVYAPGDDSIDYDEGWRGKVQFAFVVQGTPGTDKSDKYGEHDGGNNPDGSQPRAIPTLYNVTAIGLGANKAFTDAAKNTALHFRDNAGGRYYNSFFGDFGGTTLLIEGGNPGQSSTQAGSSGERAITAYTQPAGNCSVTTATACTTDAGCPGGEVCVLHYLAPSSSFQLELQDNAFWCFGNTNVVPTTPVAAQAAGGDNKEHYDNGAFTNAALDNDYFGCASPAPIRLLTRGVAAATTPDPVTSINPLPTAGSLTSDRNAPADGFFESAQYQGAFKDSNWAEGWTNMSRLGYFPPKTQVLVGSNVAVSETWTPANDYVLTQPIYVTSGATLTIEPGTVIRGEGESSPGANDPGTLIVARGSKLQAIGDENNPIVFTNLDDDNVGGNPGTFPYDSAANALGVTGTWGGVILLGRGYVANNTLAGPVAGREIQIEGLTAAGGLGLYGNCAASALFPSDCDDDDSGTLRYASLRYGGFNLSANNEINGLTLGAVGRETDVDHIEVFQNKDDGIEFFGGAASIKNAVVYAPGDDSIDYDEGWRGKVQFAFVVQGTPGTDKSDKYGEHDGGNNPDGSQPRAIPTLYNVTAIGLGANKAFTDAAKNTALHFRDNAGGRYYNSFFGDFGGSTLLIEGGNPGQSSTQAGSSGERAITAYTQPAGNCSVTTATACTTDAGCPGGEVCVLHYLAPSSSFQLELQDNAFWCFGNTNVIPTTPVAAQAAGGDNKEHYDNGVFTTVALGNTYSTCASPLPIRDLDRGTAAATIPDPIGAIDPRPATGSALLTTARNAPADGFFMPASYKGAFQGSNWAEQWTNLSRLGYFPACGDSPDAAPNEVGLIRYTVDKQRLSWTAPALPGGMGAQAFDVVRKTGTTGADAANLGTGGGCIETNDGDTVVIDPSTPAPNSLYFYAVRAGNSCGEGPLGYYSTGTLRPGPSCP